MAAASPISALADRVSEIRDAVMSRCAELTGLDSPAARSELMNLREALRSLGLAEDRMRMSAAADRPRVPRIEESAEAPRANGLPPGRPHP